MKNRVYLFLMLSIILCGCKTRTVVMTVPEVRTDTVIITKSQRDSIWLHDSTHVSEKQAGDTVWLEVKKWQTKYVERLVRDTIYISKSDTIVRTYPVDVVKEVPKPLTRRQEMLIGIGRIGLLVLLILAVVFIWKLKS